MKNVIVFNFILLSLEHSFDDYTKYIDYCLLSLLYISKELRHIQRNIGKLEIECCFFNFFLNLNISNNE